MRLKPEMKLRLLWESSGYMARVEYEYRFNPTRRWRFDFALPSKKVAVEAEGGHWQIGRHQRPIGFKNDCEKYNNAALLGWVVFRLTSDMITEEWIDNIINFCKTR